MKKIIITLSLMMSFLMNDSMAQATKKEVNASKIKSKISIDGKLDETAWQQAALAKDFVMYRPGIGNPEPSDKKTTVKILYDNEAIYFGAYLKDTAAHLIPRQFGERNQFTQADFFGIIINPYNDSVKEYEFFIMSTGVQADAISIEDAEDYNWNQVWNSAVTITDDGWIVEVRIPFAALRFPTNAVQSWGLNFHRRIRSTDEQYSWNLIDKTKGYRSQFTGILNGLENIQTPTRLSLSPYTVLSHSNVSNNLKASVGMDLKYGINDSYTIDATLIPDFSQASFDHEELNLGPYEQQFSENRSFFKEGTELFSKGNLFYSRRIGSKPTVPTTIDSNLQIDEIPNATPLLNAVKFSGRSNHGLGIGVFNAISKAVNVNGVHRQRKDTVNVLLSPVSNQNVIVIDQQFGNNSSVSLVNTNVFRKGEYRKANVSALLFNLVNKKNHYAKGGIQMSSINENKQKVQGLAGDLSLGKNNGTWQYNLATYFADDLYNPNDLGFLGRNNYLNVGANISYRIFEPKGVFNMLQAALEYRTRLLFKPSEYLGNDLNLAINAKMRNQYFFSIQVANQIGIQKDYFYKSLAVGSNYFARPSNSKIQFSINSDPRKKLSYLSTLSFTKEWANAGQIIDFGINPIIRMSDRFILDVGFRYRKSSGRFDYAGSNNNRDYFAQRNESIYESKLSSKYFFNTKMFLSLAMRYYYAPVHYGDDFYMMQSDNVLTKSNFETIENFNLGIWNVNINFSWEFAPGSNLVLQYAQYLRDSNNENNIGYMSNLGTLLNEELNSGISLKLVYYLDSNQIIKPKAL